MLKLSKIKASKTTIANELDVVNGNLDSYINDAYNESRGADESRWASRTSNPLGGISSVFGGFDSHALPP